MRVGIIGGTGWLGGALGRALVDKGLAEVALLNRSGPQDYGGRKVRWAADLADLVALSDVIVVSVRPGDWPGLDLKAGGRLVISFMAGVGLETLASCGGRIVRAMPNAAAEIGASYSPWVAGPGVTEADRAAVAQVLGAIGTGEELPEEGQIELMTALSGSGPAYPALLAQAMLGFLAERGVAPDVAARAVEAVVCASARLLEGQVAGAPALVQTFIAYRGTTCAGLEAAEAAGFTAAVKAGLAAATAKAAAMREAARQG
ncbi:NAD(P)-binding domain-containing protein [Rhodobacter sp. SGA-6-6]|uniref:pyrroline-5-carboxylate reductase family protein n=1 Tax=Rhodobacter sp. SGA-6-6 TaxID=2710882 RepID=UPI0013EBCBE9|nr:pyrroline-5-carboxylate reductase dimerization domain-containing protein [Rhodobacter sp. SGA-6-6]NGM44553.1 NAD(P)-binding domain-containing protein [Rhodobacter sp. SGA-6-6]